MADPQTVVEASTLQMVGAGCFGGLIGWLLYSFNRQRKEQPTLGDIVTILGAIGGSAVLALFPARSDLFGAYGIGLAIGFALYFLTLVIMVKSTDNFTIDWFLDGRRKKPVDPFYVPTRDEQAAAVNAPMGDGQQQKRQG